MKNWHSRTAECVKTGCDFQATSLVLACFTILEILAAQGRLWRTMETSGPVCFNSRFTRSLPVFAFFPVAFHLYGADLLVNFNLANRFDDSHALSYDSLAMWAFRNHGGGQNSISQNPCRIALTVCRKLSGSCLLCFYPSPQPGTSPCLHFPSLFLRSLRHP